MKTMTLEAKARDQRGSREARRLRDGGHVPAVLYGGAVAGKPNREVTHLLLDQDAIETLLKHHSVLIDLAVGPTKEITIIKEVQRDAFGDKIMHVDFERVDLTKPITVQVQLLVKGMPKGLAKGGHLRVELHALELVGLPTQLPEEIVARVDDLDMDEVLRVKDLKLPDGVKTTAHEDQVVAAVRAAIVEAEPEAAVPGAEAAPSEPEVIGRKLKEDEEAEEAAAEEKK